MNNQKNTPERNLHPEVKPTCKNCKWWKRDSTCEFITTTTGEEAYKKGHGAVIEIWALDEVQLKTGPDFGCVNFHPDEQGS